LRRGGRREGCKAEGTQPGHRSMTKLWVSESGLALRTSRLCRPIGILSTDRQRLWHPTSRPYQTRLTPIGFAARVAPSDMCTAKLNGASQQACTQAHSLLEPLPASFDSVHSTQGMGSMRGWDTMRLIAKHQPCTRNFPDTISAEPRLKEMRCANYALGQIMVSVSHALRMATFPRSGESAGSAVIPLMEFVLACPSTLRGAWMMAGMGGRKPPRLRTKQGTWAHAR
jgi:hypothetical protein